MSVFVSLAEIHALNAAADRYERERLGDFDEAYVDLMQAIRRFTMIAEVEAKAPKKVFVAQATFHEPTKPVAAMVLGYEGNPCPICGQLKMRRTGTCLTCYGCGHNEGC